MNYIKKLKSIFAIYNIDGYIIPKNDEYFSEFSYQNRLKKISNFSGSAGVAIIFKNKNYLFVDGRYTIQAQKESGYYYNIFEIPRFSIKQVLKDHKYKTFGYDPKIITTKFLNQNLPEQCNLNPINKNLVDLVCGIKKEKIKPFYYLDEKVTGEKTVSKLKKISIFMKKKKIDNLFISAPENVAWLLNLRGFDNPNTPMPNCNVILDKFKNIYFFSDEKKIKKIKKIKKNFNIKYFKINAFFKVIEKLNGNNFSLDKNTCSNYYEKIILSKFRIQFENDPCYFYKSIKNNTEISNLKKIHVRDGVALTKFIYWIKNRKKNVDEIQASKKIEFFRKKNKSYLFPSFNTISGSGPNASIIHYAVNKKSNRIISKKDIFLIDSGGQYRYGTTDVTRTICFKKPNAKIKNIFTRVLKGHISVVNFNLKKNSNGSKIDEFARKSLREVNLDYPHGTGHGVGFFLNVHEGPQALSRKNFITLKEGMVLSNEPGYYKKKKFGIRIENLIYIKKTNKKNYFENLTLAPIEKDMINFNILDNKEKDYLRNYHFLVYKKLKRYLNYKEKNWLKTLI